MKDSLMCLSSSYTSYSQDVTRQGYLNNWTVPYLENTHLRKQF